VATRRIPSTNHITQPSSGHAITLETAANDAVIISALKTAANAVVITDAKGITRW